MAAKPRIAVLSIAALGALYFALTWSSQHTAPSSSEASDTALSTSDAVSPSAEPPPRPTEAAPLSAHDDGAGDQPEPQSPPEPGRVRPNILNSIGARLPPVVSPDWADEVEAKILDHMALYPDVMANTVLVQCAEDACTVLIQADHTIDPFQLEFDRFAEANGFKSAIIHTTDFNTRIITLLRH